MSTHGLAGVKAVERMSAPTIIYRDKIPVAAIVPHRDLDRLEPRDPGADGDDPLLSFCGSCKHDVFVDMLNDDLGQTMLFIKR